MAEFYAIRYRRRKRSFPVTLFFNPSSADKDYVLARAKSMTAGAKSLDLESVEVVRFQEVGIEWSKDKLDVTTETSPESSLVQGPTVDSTVRQTG